MNFDALTEGQRQSVLHVRGPLLVSAGAGSGKTFTLTQRIAYALLPESGPAAQGIDEVCAITFTEKAAAEIKARVKRTLRREGLAGEALKVDGAWISTIHGMCARILRTHALELGIDPAFTVIADAERADLIAAAIDEALGSDNAIIARGSYAELFDDYPARSTRPTVASVSSLLEAVLNRAAGLRGGLDAFSLGPVPASASSLARELLTAYENVEDALEQAGSSAAAERSRAQARAATSALEDFLVEGGSDCPLFAFAEVMDACPCLPRNFGGVPVKEAIGRFQGVYKRVAQNLALGLGRPLAEQLLSLAREVAARYEAKKRLRCALDNDDLLIRTLAALEEHPAIAQRYAERFKLVMVDEFQDTSQLQIDLIAHLAGERAERLCTVGDSQQSIYRFRGADVNVYEAHKLAMRSSSVGALDVQLARNFRSHADVLAFVERVFSQPDVFGEAFMPLEPDAMRPSKWKGVTPRIEVVLAMRPGGRNTGVSIEDAKHAEARAIAERFAALRAAGHEPRDMVVLLGKMTRADVYAEALRAEGFECVVTGGSLFGAAPEVRLVARLLEVIANPANTAALFEVLSSDMLRLSADDFLDLSTEIDQAGQPLRRRDLDRGFSCLAETADELSPRLRHSVVLLDRARAEAREHSAARAVRQAVVESGWLARLEAEGAAGLARAANVLKAIRMIETIEHERCAGVATVARAFSHELAIGLKEAPGALAGAEGGVVKIMTIHASKGLEFPVVAVADFAGATAPSGRLLVEACGPRAFASLLPKRGLEDYPTLEKHLGSWGDAEEETASALDAAQRALEEGTDAFGAACAIDAAAFREALRRRIAREELAEARRKLYVAFTRASEALVVTMCAKAPASGKPPAYADLVDDLRRALVGGGDFPQGEALLDYGGSAPARFVRIPVEAKMQNAVRVASDRPFFLPLIGDDAPLKTGVAATLRGDVFSYSSIAPHEDKLPAHARAAAPVADGDATQNLSSEFSPFDSGEADERARRSDVDKATGLGSAFHRAAQYEVECGQEPDAVRTAEIARTYRLGEAAYERLTAALARWFASADCARTRTYAHRLAEVPFFVPVGEEFLEGEIDLLCTEGAEAPALVIDYKTGGTDDETSAQLRAKHELQARCYAFALLGRGHQSVELRFERVERAAADGDPQVVVYRYDAADLPALQRAIAAARRAALS